MTNKSIDKRFIAIIAHVDHGKTTLVDQLLRQSGNTVVTERVMDSHALEQERGLTIFSKNACIHWKNYHIHLMDTPGHADFGGEVERILSAVDAVLLVVDAVEGVMPQTRFVTKKALENQCIPIVVVNKIDREGVRADEVVDEVYNLFFELEANDKQLEFPVVYASATQGYATKDLNVRTNDMNYLFECIIQYAPPPKSSNQALQMQIFSLDYSSYLGMIGIAKIYHGSVRPGEDVYLLRGQERRKVQIKKLFTYVGLIQKETNIAEQGDVVAITGIDDICISDTIGHKECTPLSTISIDPPTLSICFQANNSLFGGSGKYLTSRLILDRLHAEARTNVSLRIETLDMNNFQVFGRGELHLSTLIETMRREGYEFCIAKPKIVTHKKENVTYEPYENLVLDIQETHQGAVIQSLGMRKANLLNMNMSRGRVYLEYHITTRMLIGLHEEITCLTAGTAIMHHGFAGYSPLQDNQARRENGVLIANQSGKTSAFALFNLQARGQLLIVPKTEVYEGMIVGIHNRKNDLVVNVVKGKQLTNMRAAGSDENITLSPVKPLTLEYALTFIEDDELVEITPNHIRLRKKYLQESERKRKNN